MDYLRLLYANDKEKRFAGNKGAVDKLLGFFYGCYHKCSIISKQQNPSKKCFNFEPLMFEKATTGWKLKCNTNIHVTEGIFVHY